MWVLIYLARKYTCGETWTKELGTIEIGPMPPPLVLPMPYGFKVNVSMRVSYVKLTERG